jgi:nitroreductase
MDERLRIIFSRRSIREYTGQPVSEADITSLLQAGMAAPSAANRKPWHLVVVTDRQTLGAIAAAPPYSRTLGGAALVIVVCGDPLYAVRSDPNPPQQVVDAPPDRRSHEWSFDQPI